MESKNSGLVVMMVAVMFSASAAVGGFLYTIKSDGKKSGGSTVVIGADGSVTLT